MENKDFRDRLREHQVQPNSESWEMMQAMLSSAEEPKKKKRRGFIFWFFGIGLLVLSCLFFTNYNLNQNSKEIPEGNLEASYKSNTVNISSNTNNYSNLIDTLSSYSINKNQKNKDLIVSNIDLNKNQRNELANANKKQNRKPDNNQSILKSKLTSNTSFLKTDTRNNISGSTENTNVSFNSKFPDHQTSPNINANNVDSSIEEKTTLDDHNKDNSKNRNSNQLVSGLNISETNEVNNKSESSKVEIEQSETEKNNNDLKAKSLLEKLPTLHKFNFIKSEDVTIDLDLKKESKWMYFGQIGLNSFNNNPGLIFGGGLLYKFDKLLYFESMISYAYGKETGVPIGESGTHENEIDLGILVNLNFINARKSRLALELGTGLTRYWGTRVINSMPITLDERSSFGTHIQGGLSYNYFVNKNTNLGLKFGVVSYDDAHVYLALKYYKKF